MSPVSAVLVALSGRALQERGAGSLSSETSDPSALALRTDLLSSSPATPWGPRKAGASFPSGAQPGFEPVRVTTTCP